MPPQSSVARLKDQGANRELVQGEQVTYVNGEEYIYTVDSDFMSYFELMDIIKNIGYPNHPIVYYKLPNYDMNTSLVELTCSYV